ncbi:MAG: type II toxin-antitoxin system RelE/ParE family toxin [Dysgonamonadaceae bacterium]|jgi:plasmid stabilization system protein ParE|nr:type II toxin-antitoxin system RelE/ParE family toxin [Dysgonamonadaceae bacterium]
MKVILLPKALSRLDEIFDWIKTTNNENAAVKVYNSILDELEILEKQPEIAAIEPTLEDLPQQFRSLVVNRKYKAVYYIEKQHDTVFVATIWDCRQNPVNLTKELF